MRRRTMVLRFLVAIGLLVMVGRLAWFQVVKAEELIAREEEWRLQMEALAPVRGALKDRAGRYLAVSVPTRSVVASPYHIGAERFAEVATALAPLLGMQPEVLAASFAEKPASQYLPLKKGLDLATAEQIQKLKLPGISLLAETRRTYPQGAIANQLIGWIDSEGVGQYGLEAQYDEQLRGKAGFVRAELTHNKTPIEGTIKSQVPAEPGLDLILTTDGYLQQTFEEALDEVIKQEDAKRALAIAMDVKTGEILAMAMRPGADLSDRSTWTKPDGSVDYDRLNNWAVTPMPPGSIFKTITAAIALENRVIDLNSWFSDSGKMTIDGWTILNWDRVVPVEPKMMSLAELFQTSSNIGLIQIGQRIPHETFAKYLEIFGFMEPTGLDFPHESGANGLADFGAKQEIDWANMYIGQHLEVTPLQMLRAVAAIANGGHLVQPHLVKEMRNQAGEVTWSAPTAPLRTAISAQTAREVRELMVSVVENAHRTAKIEGYTVGGKTGTAQKFENGREKERGLADFVGFAPASDPRVAMLVLVDEPRPPGYGGVIAAPLFGKLMPHVLRTLAIPPDAPVTQPAATAVTPTPTLQVAVPDVRFLPAAWAEQKLREAGFEPKRVGDGAMVAEQSLPPRSAAKAGSVVELKLAPRGAENLSVPDFSGLTLAEASRLAAEIGLVLKQAGGSGFVVEQNPAVGAQVAPESVVAVKLSATRPGQP